MANASEPPNGRIFIGDSDQGGGFALQPRTVVTAAHVIGDAGCSEVFYVPHRDGPRIPVASIERDAGLDVAALRLETDVPVAFRAAVAVEDLRVRVDAAPHGHAPRLTGVVRATDWLVTLRSGTRANVLQIGVDHPLSSYSGYSGCAVSSTDGLAVGLLVEQVPNPGPVGSGAAPLLYALPIQAAIEALALDVAVGRASGNPLDRHAEAALAPPPPSPTFVAREVELDDLVQRWSEGVDKILLHGLPGGGKSALAAEAAGLAVERFPDGVLYLDLRGLDDPDGQVDSALHQILAALGVPQVSRPVTANQKATLARTLLEDRQMLVVLDDVRDEQQLRPLLVAGSGSSTLITSRSSLPAVADLHRLEVEALGPDDGLQLLEQLIGRERVQAERDEALRMIELCGGLPLALRITGSRLATRPAWSIGEYAERLTDERRRLEGLSLGDLDVRASFELSYRLLSDDEQRALRHVGLLRSPTVSAESVGAALDSDAGDLLESLVDAGLLTARHPRYEVHDLIRIFARDLLDEEEFDLGLRRLGDFYVNEVHTRGIALRTGESLDALRWMTEERATLENLPSALDAAGLKDLTIGFALSLGPLAVPMHAWRMWERAIQIALDAAAGQAEDPEEVVLDLTQSLGVVKAKLGEEREALRLFGQVIDIARGSGNSRLEARALAQLGQLAKQDGRPQDAVELLEESAAAYEKVGEEHGYAQALGDWANALDDLGEHEEALERHLDAAQRFKDLGDLYSYGLEQGNAGIALHRLERFPEAAEAHLDSMKAFESIEAHIPAAVAKWRRAWPVWRQGDVPEAERLFAEAREVLERAEQHQELAELFAAREACLVESDRFQEALADAMRAVDLYAKAKDVRNEALERARIGVLRQRLGDGTGSADFAQAEELFGVNDRPSGPRAAALSHRAAEALGNGDSKGAVELWQRAVEMFIASGMSWRAADVLHTAAPLLEEMGQKDHAEKFRQRTTELLCESKESLPPSFQGVSVSGTQDPWQWALLFLWLARARGETGFAGNHEVTVIPHSDWPAGVMKSFDADRMYVHPDLADARGARAYFLLGWEIHVMLAGQELMRRGVRPDDETGPFLFDLAGEWLATTHFRDEEGTPMLRSAPPPTGSSDLRPLGSSVGAALAGSDLHLQEVNEWLQRNDDSPFCGLVEELMPSLSGIESSEAFLDALATYRREERPPRGPRR